MQNLEIQKIQSLEMLVIARLVIERIIKYY